MHKKGEHLQLNQEKYMGLHQSPGTTLGPPGPSPTHWVGQGTLVVLLHLTDVERT